MYLRQGKRALSDDCLYMYITNRLYLIPFVPGTHTETSTTGKAARDPTCRSSTESETSSKRNGTRGSRSQAGPDTEREKSTKRKATRGPNTKSGLGTESGTSTEDEATRAPLIESGEHALAGL